MTLIRCLGNVARLALSHHELLSELLSSEKNKVPAKLIENFYLIGIAINCTRKIDPNKLFALCQETKKIYFDNKLDWYPFCSAVHKVMEHSADCLRHLQSKSHVLALGWLFPANKLLSFPHFIPSSALL